LLETREQAQAEMASTVGSPDLDGLSDAELDLYEAAAALLAGKARLDLSSYSAEQISMIEGCLRGAPSPAPRTSEAILADMRAELAAELDRHAAAAERELPRPPRPRPIEELVAEPLLDPGQPLPSHKAPAARPARIEALPPTPSNYAGVYEPAPRVERNGVGTRSPDAPWNWR
jgi:hypothetical protein